MTEPRSVLFNTGWEPDPDELRVVADYLCNDAPEQCDMPRWDHCEGLAVGILQSLHFSAQRRTDPNAEPLSEPERLRYIAQAAALGAEIERLSTENRRMEAFNLTMAEHVRELFYEKEHLKAKLGHFERAAQERLRLSDYRVDL
jgi:hypothetical protein